MATVDEYVLPPDVTEVYKKAPRTEKKQPGKFTLSGNWRVTFCFKDKDADIVDYEDYH